MDKLKQAETTSLFMSLLLIITLALLIQVNSARAKEAEAITPNLGFDYFLLLEGQSVTSSTTQTIPFDLYTVGIVSIGNDTLSASLSVRETEATGFWWVSIIGTGGIYWYDFEFGIIPVSGSSASINVSKVISLALAIGGLYLTSPVSAEDPVKYNITVR
jgi:hypothetical protein